MPRPRIAKKLPPKTEWSAEPWGHPKASDNQETYGSGGCGYCFRPVTNPQAFVRIIDGGYRFWDGAAPIDEAGDMGYSGVGPECARFLRSHGVVLFGDAPGARPFPDFQGDSRLPEPPAQDKA